MSDYIESYDSMPHGTTGFRMAVYSERIYGSLPHHHREYCLFYMKQGCLLFGLNNHEFYVRDGDILFIEPNTPYYIFINETTSQPHEFHYYSVVFDLSLFGGDEDLCKRFLSGIHIFSQLRLSDFSLSLMPRMRKLDIEKPPGYTLLLKNDLFSIISEIIETKQYVEISDMKKTRAEISSDAVKLMIEYIETHYKENITVEDISLGLGYSLSHIHRIFKKYTGMSIIQYRNKYRIDKACLDIIYSDKKITQIAADNGFDHAKHFSKLFRERLGMTPLQYRKLANHWGQYNPSE